MKKLMLFIALFAFTATAFSQYTTFRLAYGAKGNVDTCASAAPAGGATKYFYFNNTNAVGGSIAAYATPITTYMIHAIQVAMIVPIKAADIADSVQWSLQFSYDNVYWTSWGYTSTAYTFTKPILFGTSFYVYGVAGTQTDKVTTTATASGAVFFPIGLYAPYFRVKVTSFKAAASFYPRIYVTLKKL